MALTLEESAAGDRLGLYNARKVDPVNNRYGLGQGGQRNFVQAAEDLSLFGSAIVREALILLTEAERIAGEAAIAAVIVEGGPVSSVTIGDAPPQTGAVKINLDALSAQINAELEEVRVAQAALEARAASGQAYSLAFGG